MYPFTRPFIPVCDISLIRMQHEDPYDDEFEYEMRGSRIYTVARDGNVWRHDLNVIRQNLIQALATGTINLFEHNQFISVLQLLEYGAHFPKDFKIWDITFEYQCSMWGWLYLCAGEGECVFDWPDPNNVMDFPDLESVGTFEIDVDSFDSSDDSAELAPVLGDDLTFMSDLTPESQIDLEFEVAFWV